MQLVLRAIFCYTKYVINYVINKHFFKTVFIFTLMILIGLLGVFLVNHYGNGEIDLPKDVNVAK